MKKYKIKLDDAIQRVFKIIILKKFLNIILKVKKIRMEMDPNQSFLKQLEVFEKCDYNYEKANINNLLKTVKSTRKVDNHTNFIKKYLF